MAIFLSTILHVNNCIVHSIEQLDDRDWFSHLQEVVGGATENWVRLVYVHLLGVGSHC